MRRRFLWHTLSRKYSNFPELVSEVGPARTILWLHFEKLPRRLRHADAKVIGGENSPWAEKAWAQMTLHIGDYAELHAAPQRLPSREIPKLCA